MALSLQDRTNAAAEFQRDESRELQQINALSEDALTLITALDDVLDDNAVLINNSIPEPARSGFTVRQKARAFIYVVERRYLS